MKNKSFTVSGSIIDVVNGRIFPGTVDVINGKIFRVTEEPVSEKQFILPGLVDAHIHIESSMLIPSEFARLAVIHGTVASVSDPHEIANVLGIDGIRFMIDNGKKVPFKFYFGAPSCVPATLFETAGARLGPAEIGELLSMDEILYLSEMMNFPGVLFEDEEVMAKLALARKYGKPIDGHAPGLSGDDLKKYVNAGISTDHECFTLAEAEEKAALGMKILIREGSAARNFEVLAPLLATVPEKVMFCSDDRHPDDLLRRHINDIARRAIALGYDPVAVIRACTLNPKDHYGLNTGLLQPGDPADLILVDDLQHFNVLETYIEGQQVACNGQTMIPSVDEKPVNNFHARKIKAEELVVKEQGNRIRVMEALEGQLITHEIDVKADIFDGTITSDPGRDLLKIAVLNRYSPSAPAVGFIKNFGLKRGAIASSVAHDSHNIISVGIHDDEIARAVNMLVHTHGGVCCVDGDKTWILPLPFAGLMSEADGFKVAEAYEKIDREARNLGSLLRAPFMTLSFMALLVIPELKLSDKGLFDGKTFGFTSLFLD